MSGVFQTRSQGVAAACRYLWGAKSHRATLAGVQKRDKTGCVFEFEDQFEDGEKVAARFYSDNGQAPLAIGDAHHFLEEFFQVRRTMAAAIGAPNKEWRSEQ
jgi:hypothetical protein